MMEALMILWEIFIVGSPIILTIVVLIALACYGFQMLRLMFKF
jgi:hypothetical protein